MVMYGPNGEGVIIPDWKIVGKSVLILTLLTGGVLFLTS